MATFMSFQNTLSLFQIRALAASEACFADWQKTFFACEGRILIDMKAIPSYTEYWSIVRQAEIWRTASRYTMTRRRQVLANSKSLELNLASKKKAYSKIFFTFFSICSDLLQ